MKRKQTTILEWQTATSGIHSGVPFPAYLAKACMSQSVLKQGRESMRHMKAAIDRIGIFEITDDMQQGTAMHCGFLEPAEFDRRVVQWTGPRRAGSAWDEFCDEHADQVILTPGHYANAKGMVAALRSHPEVARWAGRIEDVEVSALGMIEGVPFKGRCDALTDDPMWDLKKVRATDDQTINRTIDEFGYHIQAAIYRELFQRDRFCLGFVEGTAPYDVRPVELSPMWMKIGRSEMLGLIQRYKYSIAHRVWPFRSEEVDTIEPSDWLLQQHGLGKGITIGGEEAFGDE